MPTASFPCAPGTAVALFFEPEVMTVVPATAPCMQNAAFHPLAPIARFMPATELVADLNPSGAGLAAYFCSQNMHRCLRVSPALESSMFGVDTGLISNEVEPFGAIKESGLGREGGAKDWPNTPRSRRSVLAGSERNGLKACASTRRHPTLGPRRGPYR